MYSKPTEDGDVEQEVFFDQVNVTASDSGFTSDGGRSELPLDLAGMPQFINVELTWEDEPVRIYQRNEPDTFQVMLVPPNGTEGDIDPSRSSDTGSLSFRHNIDQDKAANWTGSGR